MKLLIVDGHLLFREGLYSLFNNQPDFEVVGDAGSVQEATSKARELKPDMILMDFTLSDGTGLDAMRAILAEQPGASIVFLTRHEEDELLLEAIRCGAKGYLLKSLQASQLLASLRSMKRGEFPISRRMAARVITEFARMGRNSQAGGGWLEALTDRELEIFRELARGASNKQIAEKMTISENTVKNHVHNILEKLKLNSRRDLAALAARHGLLSYDG